MDVRASVGKEEGFQRAGSAAMEEDHGHFGHLSYHGYRKLQVVVALHRNAAVARIDEDRQTQVTRCLR